eukprot:7387990-Prymnesium_polylepis.1
MHPAKMTFQALRIHLNEEFDEMRKGMRAAFSMVGEGGRIGLITWKFSERKIVDEVVGTLEAVRPNEPLLKWYQAQPDAAPLPDGPSLESDEVVRPSERELQRNSRSRQGLLHILHKRNVPRLAHLEKQAYALPGWGGVVAPVSSAGGDGAVLATEGGPKAGVVAEKPSGKRKKEAVDKEDEEAKPEKKKKKAEKAAKAVKAEKAEKAVKAEKAEKVEKAEKAEKAKAEKVEKVEKAEKVVKAEKKEKAAMVATAEPAEKPVKAAKKGSIDDILMAMGG